MNFVQIAAIFSGVVVTIVAVFLTSDTPQMFLDGTSFFIVVGGTFSAAAISVQIPNLWLMAKVFMRKIITGKSAKYKDVTKEILMLSNAFYKRQNLNNMAESFKDPFLKECVDLYLEKVLDDERLLTMLTDRRRNMYKRFMISVGKFKNIGKYPPAFGMMGTTMGMIVLLADLGGEDAMKTMGPAMAVCLTTTLYGVILANIFLMPVAENLEDCAREVNLKNEMVVRGLQMIFEHNPPAIIAEELNSYLEVDDRLDWKEVLQGA